MYLNLHVGEHIEKYFQYLSIRYILLNDCDTKILENRILIHLFWKQKVVDVDKLISFGKLLVRKVTRFVPSTMPAILILSHAK